MFSSIRACSRLNLVRQSFYKYSTTASVADEFIDHTRRNNYKSECYAIKTKDGYHLKMHRIFAARNKFTKSRHVLLMHGLARHSMEYLASGPSISLAYYLADAGFDVWLGNSRDTKLCTQHDEYPYLSKQFLNYNLHDIGIFDMRAFLEFILDRTAQSSISYVGHSQGGCTLLILLSTMPEFNCYINQAHLLTPAALLGGATSPILTLSAKYYTFTQKLYELFDKIDMSTMMRITKAMNESSSDEVKAKRARIVYEKFTCKLIGENKIELQIAEDALACFDDLITPYWSATHLRHFLQLHMSGKFQQFDNGHDENLKIYNSASPPEYNLQSVTSPVHLYSAAEDLLVDPRDVEKLKTLLPNVKYCEKIEDWNHMDVLLGKNARKVLYRKILDSLMNE